MIKITAVRLAQANKEQKGAIWYSRAYTSHEGLACKEFRKTQSESDYHNGLEYRVSSDNGRTYGEWQTCDRTGYSQMFGEDEYTSEEIGKVWNPVHEHYVCTLFTRYFLGGHKKAYSGYWSGKLTVFDHQYIRIYRDGEQTPMSEQMIKYEDGADFDPENPRNDGGAGCDRNGPRSLPRAGSLQRSRRGAPPPGGDRGGLYRSGLQRRMDEG